MSFRRRGAILRAVAINNLRLSEELYASHLQTLDTLFKTHFEQMLNNPAVRVPPISENDIRFIFYNTVPLSECSEIILCHLRNISETDSVCDILFDHFSSEIVQEAFLGVIIASNRSFDRLASLLNSNSDLGHIIEQLNGKTLRNETLGSILGHIAQRIHCYIPLLEEIEKSTPLDHPDAGKFGATKEVIENFIASMPVVSKIGIAKALDIVSIIETSQMVKLPRSGLMKTKLSSELIAEGIMWQVLILSGAETREKCYVILLVNKIICIPFEKIKIFKHSHVPDEFVNKASPDIKWFANLADCSFKSVPSYFLKASQGDSAKANRSAQSLKLSASGNKELFVINETSITNIEPYVVQEERYLIADIDSAKDHAYWANSFKIAQRYGLHLEVSFATVISDQITALEQCAQAQLLSSAQWKMLSKHGEHKTYSKGEKILTQGQLITKIYWLTRGTASISKQIENAVFCIGSIEKFTFFGQISYLTSTPTVTPTIVANSDTVVNSIDYKKLYKLLVKYPKFAVDFFRLSCTQITLQLMSSSYCIESVAPRSTKKIPQIARIEEITKAEIPSSLATQNPKEYKDILKSVGIQQTDTVLYGTTCKLSLPKKKAHSGTVLCLEKVVVLYSKSFGSSTSLILQLPSLNPPEIEDLTVYLSTLTDNIRYCLVFRAAQEKNKLLDTIEDAKDKLMDKVSENNLNANMGSATPDIPTLPEEDWYSLLAKAETLRFSNGDVIIRQGDRVDKLYQIYNGTCDVYIEQNTVKGSTFEVMESLDAGDRFGEGCFAIPSLRCTASIVVTSETLEVLVIPRSTILEMYLENPLLESGLNCYIAQQLAKRFIERQKVVLGLRGSMRIVKSKRDTAGHGNIRAPYIRWSNSYIDAAFPELVAMPDGYHVEYGNFNVPQSDRTPIVQDIEDDYHIYRTDFVKRPHINLIGYSSLDEEFVAISICLKKYMEDVKVIVILRRESDGIQRIKFSLPNEETVELNSHTTIPILKYRVPGLVNYHFYQVSEEKNEMITKDFIAYENNEIVVQYKFGLLYVTGDQDNETAYYSNAHLSPDLIEFMVALGNFVELENWEGFNGGLDVSGKNITGGASLFCHFDNFYDIMFHVAPLIPCEPNDEQHIGRKRHLGNDMVILVFTDSDIPFDPSGFQSHFNHCFIVVKKLPVEACGGPTYYRIETICKAAVPYVYRPVLNSPPIVPKSEIKKYILTKLINAQRMAMKTTEFAKKTIRTRHHLLENYASKYAPHLQNPPARAISSPRGVVGRL